MTRILLLLIAISLFSCEDKDNYTLTGDAQGFEDGAKILVFNFKDNQPQIMDTLVVKAGKFSATYPNATEAELNFLRPDGTNGSVIFFPDSEDLKVVMYKDSIYASSVSGSAPNESYSAFSKKMYEYNNKKQKNMELFRQANQANDSVTLAKLQNENLEMVKGEADYKKQFVKENTNSIFTVMLLSEMLNRQEITSKEASEVINTLSPKVASSEITVALKKAIESLTAAEVGSAAPQFSAPTPTGETMSLKDAMGKYTIIDFWASWCKPCRMENPNVVAVYNKYHDKGLNIISVSLDKAEMKDKWIQAIADDKMDWYHVSNLQFWQDPIAGQYGVRAIPATFLLDENGIIIDKDLRGPALEAKIASLLGQ